jgi:nucleotidyltransferase substrate binding protein (TIGR01987 family)
MTAKDIRWIQRFNNFSKALAQLKEVVDAAKQRELSKLEALGAVHIFEYTHELAWKTLKDFLENRGVTNLFISPKDITRAAFKSSLLENGEIWMQMIESRKLIAHAYYEEIASEITSAVIGSYFFEFEKLQTTLVVFKQQEE